MKYMTGNELREAYLEFFAQKKGHLRLPSASLIPENDPTLLMIGAGMAPFKPFFTGKMKPPRTRITTSQRCVRTGDIENVGRTARHQTYFEMLGNFSFGDYFKAEAIPWAWEFLTEVLELPKNKLWVTVYPKDDEAASIWQQQPGFPQDHIVKLEDNFWEIGPGPCGPDSEIYIDLGEERGCGKPTCGVGCDCDRYLEIWNLVFTQFDRTEDGQYLPLAHKNIDTGCGLERLASVLQNKPSNFETDLLFPIIEYASKVSHIPYGQDSKKDISLKVIADHARSMAIMIMDGILPSNEGRGYVLRRILRRAVRHGRLLGIQGEFLAGAVDAVVEIYKDAADFEELANKRNYIQKVVRLEEERFAKTLAQGTELLEAEIRGLQARGETTLAGKVGFMLYDTYGFPWELTEEILHEQGLAMDRAGFDAEMEAQKKRAREARQKNQRVAVPDLSGIDISQLKTDAQAKEAKVVAIWKDGGLCEELLDGEEAGVILSVTPFYAEGGGQVGDEGLLTSTFGKVKVSNAKHLPDGTIYHLSYMEEGELHVGDTVQIAVDWHKKLASARNHTATHLLQAALKRVVGSQVNQAGSLVTPDRLRFDFSNFEPVSAEQLQEVERLVNEQVLMGKRVEIQQMPVDEAKKLGAMALFGEKYGDIVRVVTVPGFSRELCGGSHVENVGEIGAFKIISESGVAAGVRRIEAITGEAALHWFHEKEASLDAIAKELKCQPQEAVAQVQRLLKERKAMASSLAEVAQKEATQQTEQLLQGAQEIHGVRVVFGQVAQVEAETLRTMADTLTDKLDGGVVVLGTVHEGKVLFIAKAGPAALAKGAHAGKVVKSAAKIVGGGGGGRPEMAQAGGKLPAQLPAALKEAEASLRAQLQ